MGKGWMAGATLLGVLLTNFAAVHGHERSYMLIPYDVPSAIGNNTSLFDRLGRAPFLIGTYFSTKQGAFGDNLRRNKFTTYNIDDSFINFVVAVSPVAIVGSADLPSGKRVGTIWPRHRTSRVWEKILGPTIPLPSSPKEPILIDITPYKSTALLGLNSRGHLVGTIQRADATFRGFSIVDGTTTIFDYPEAQSTFAEGMRKDGTIVGTYVKDNISHGFIRDARGQFASFDIPGACATLIYDTNDKGDIAGAYIDCPSGQTRGYVFTRKEQVLDIYFPGDGTTATEVLGLDERGNIVGRFDNASGRHGFVGESN